MNNFNRVMLKDRDDGESDFIPIRRSERVKVENLFKTHTYGMYSFRKSISSIKIMYWIFSYDVFYCDVQTKVLSLRSIFLDSYITRALYYFLTLRGLMIRHLITNNLNRRM